MILITAKVHDILRETLQASGFAVHYAPDISYDEVRSLMPQVTGLVVTTRLKIDRNLIDQGPQLKWIGRLGSGLELIDTAYARERNILCVSSPEGNRNAVAEHALGMLLNLLNNISRSFEEVKHLQWLRNENRGTELSGKTIGLVGYGNTGGAFAKLLQPFGGTILAYDKYKTGFGDQTIREANFEQVCKYADVISFHVPLTDETRYMAGEEFFALLKRRPWILNTSRGAVVKTSALIAAINEDKVAGAGLDVLENEKLDNLTESQRSELEQLVAMDNVLLTPHIAGYTHEAFYKMSKVLLEKLGI
ncbi:MAG: hydroxyacid dehydrogenase [Ferruginibacter sp.]|nr:hydroxyacid dehydrogenase [Ferruginibacter sp.]